MDAGDVNGWRVVVEWHAEFCAQNLFELGVVAMPIIESSNVTVCVARPKGKVWPQARRTP